MGTLAPDKIPMKTVGSFWPYATTLFDYVRRAMPFQESKSLTADELYAVSAYILNLNGIVGSNDVLDAQSLPKVRMPNRDGFIPFPRNRSSFGPDLGLLMCRFFGRRDEEPFHALWRPASKKRQARSRGSWAPVVQRALWGFDGGAELEGGCDADRRPADLHTGEIASV